MHPDQHHRLSASSLQAMQVRAIGERSCGLRTSYVIALARDSRAFPCSISARWTAVLFSIGHGAQAWHICTNSASYWRHHCWVLACCCLHQCSRSSQESFWILTLSLTLRQADRRLAISNEPASFRPHAFRLAACTTPKDTLIAKPRILRLFYRADA